MEVLLNWTKGIQCNLLKKKISCKNLAVLSAFTVVLCIQLIVSTLLWALILVFWKKHDEPLFTQAMPRTFLCNVNESSEHISSLIRTWDCPFQLIKTSSLCYLSNLIFYSINALLKILLDTEGINSTHCPSRQWVLIHSAVSNIWT